MIANALNQKPMPVYGDGQQIRDWLFVEDHCRAIDTIVRHGTPGRTYNIGGNNELANLDLVYRLCDTLEDICPRADGTSYRSLITFVEDRLVMTIDTQLTQRVSGRSSIGNLSRLSTLAWKTIQWYPDNQEWVVNLVESRSATQRRGIR